MIRSNSGNAFDDLTNFFNQAERNGLLGPIWSDPWFFGGTSNFTARSQWDPSNPWASFGSSNMFDVNSNRARLRANYLARMQHQADPYGLANDPFFAFAYPNRDQGRTNTNPFGNWMSSDDDFFGGH